MSTILHNAMADLAAERLRIPARNVDIDFLPFRKAMEERLAQQRTAQPPCASPVDQRLRDAAAFADDLFDIDTSVRAS